MSVRTKIVAAFAAVAAIIAFLGLYSIIKLQDVNRRVDQTRQESFLPLRGITDLQHLNDDQVTQGAIASYATDPAVKGDAAKELVAGSTAIETALAGFDRSSLDPETRRLFEQVVTRSSSVDRYINEGLGTRIPVLDEGAPRITAAELRPVLAARTEAIAKIKANLTALEERGSDAIHEESTRATRTVMVVLVAAVVAALAVALGLSGRIARRLLGVVEVVDAVAAGDLTPRADTSSDDEVGRMARALNRGLDRVEETIAAIARSSRSLANSSEQLTSVSQQMTAGAEQTADRATTMSAATDQISGTIATVSTGAEQVRASIQEIARSTTDAARVTGHAVAAAESTNATVAQLGDSSAEIGEVLKVITSIAAQTNLLALNATIEAARAGDAGRGFAVVANEVKELAKQTGDATEDIGRRIAAIQGDTTSAVSAIAQIGAVIGQVNEIQATIAAAVEEQSVTTDAIARAVTEAADGADGIAESVTGVADAAATTTSAAGQTHDAATALAATAAELEGLVAQFHLTA